MSRLDTTLSHLAPGVTISRDLNGYYNPRHGLAIYCLPFSGHSPASPGVVLGEALASRSGLGCTLLEGIPDKVPGGAVVIGHYNALKATRPDLAEAIPELRERGQYAIRLGHNAVVTSLSSEGLAAGMQTLSMIVLRHNEDLLPGCVILDTPLCHVRGLAVELKSDEICITLLMQIASFAATFKANRLHLILDGDFNPGRSIPGIEAFTQSCHSFGIELGVRVPLLRHILSGEKTVLEAWAAVRAAARVFGATQAAFDDPCPANANPGVCERIVASVANGDVGLQHFSLDAKLILCADYPTRQFQALGITGWHRMWEKSEAPPSHLDGIPLILDVQAPVPGFSHHAVSAFHRRINAAMRHLRRQSRREILFSFRNIGVSHMWQNMLYPAATGLISAWGNPVGAEEAALNFSNLLYGSSAKEVMDMWEMVAAAFPPGMTAGEEKLLRRTAFGRWPESKEDFDILQGIDWGRAIPNIRNAVAALKNVASNLSRNGGTLAGARLALYTLSWLHCFLSLMPELERRREMKFDADGRTEPIANELFNSFRAWHAHLHELTGESGMEFSEMAQIESMGLRLKGLCEGIFE